MQVLGGKFLSLDSSTTVNELINNIINQDLFSVVPHLPIEFVDLLILDPPYNISKSYDGQLFREKHSSDYRVWFASLIDAMKPLLKPRASIYVCADWKTSVLIAPILEKHFHIQNRITWEREKGRGALANWKNSAEDIWFCTMSRRHTFNLDNVKIKRRVIAPYRTDEGDPKDWHEESGDGFRLTCPSNLWTDITVPFWSMRENTDHPTQKPEKLIAKLVLASSNPGDLVFDPFLGSGTSAVVAHKLGRRFLGVEVSRTYCCWAQKRLEMAHDDPSIQGFVDGVFWDRNVNTGKSRRAPSLGGQRVRLL